jgi:MFS family permease
LCDHVPLTAARPTRTRFTVLRYALLLSIVTYLDRVAISSAAPVIRQDLHLDLIQMGWVFSAFTFAYAAFEIPSGWLGDVIGPRKVLTRIVLWWSAFTMLTGVTWNYASILVARFMFGAGEAGAFPNLSRSFANWFPADERGHAHGVIFMGTRLGGAIAPALVAVLMDWVGWRETFFVFGALGVVWCVFWWKWVTDDPAAHPSVNALELETIRRGQRDGVPQPLPWRRLLSWNLTLICAMYFCQAYTLYFNLTWLPTYMRDVRGFTLRESGYIAGVVLACGAAANWLGGRLTDRLVRTRGLKTGRSIGVVTLPLSGALLVAAALMENRIAAVVLFALTMGVSDLCLSACWAICHDVGGEYTGTVTAAMNTVGNIGGAISPLVVGYAVQSWGSWTIPFFIAAGVYAAGGMLTWLINPSKPLWEPRPASPGVAAL